MKLLDLRFGRGVIVVWPIESNASRSPSVVDVCAQHVPTLAQVQHAVVTLPRPALWCYPDPFILGHKTLPARLQKDE